MTFFPEVQGGDACADSSGGVSFTTVDVPVSQCFDVKDVFGSNVTQGFRNESLGFTDPTEGMHWSVGNSRNFDSTANYSHIRYEQADPNQPRPGELAMRRVNLYNGENCLQTSEVEDGDILPWFSWTCQSNEDDDCRTTPYSIGSFRISDAEERDGQCYAFALQGSAVSRFASQNTAVAALVSAITVGLFVL